MSSSGSFSIRPAGKHIFTIGRDLIQNEYAAVIELVKNAYDADSPDVNIIFKAEKNRKSYSIIIEDHGHGMSRDTVINKWMVPSTDDKIIRRRSPQGRIMQGEKGVGRYAASILGKDLLLETVTPNGEKTTVYIEWSDFEKAEYLNDVKILIDTEKTKQPFGTRLSIKGDAEQLSEWDNKRFDLLKFELKKLKSPIMDVLTSDDSEDLFVINLTIENFSEKQTDIIHETITPYPIIDLYDYKIAGKVNADGKGTLIYSIQKARNTTEEIIPFNFGGPTECGDLNFDIRVYDRDKESINALIERGLKDEAGIYVSNLEARSLLTISNGIGVYRNGFRVRPLGDPEFDWLKLNIDRVQNPSMKIGSNQVIGYVQIQSQEQSGLIEKSARDGLRDNSAFERLKKITKNVISELEKRRFIYRQKAGLSRSVLRIEQELERLLSFVELKHKIRARLIKKHVDINTTDEIINILNEEEEKKELIIEDIRQKVAVYQGQATLGKIINVVLHEGRRPLNYFKNQIPNLKYWLNSFQKTQESNTLQKIVVIGEGIGTNADVLVMLFSRLDPLAAGKRGVKKKFPLKKLITDNFYVFEETMTRNKISFSVIGPEEFEFSCWRQDMYAIFTNLIDNSVYWMNEKKSNEKKILIEFINNDQELQYIDYRDTGPGIEPSLISSEVIFDPGFSTKPEGTGLGLAIAGEAAARNGLELKAFESSNGVYFRLQSKIGH